MWFLGFRAQLGSCGAQTWLLRGMWDPPRPGITLMSHVLLGGFSTPEPPGKPPACPSDLLFCWTFKHEFVWQKKILPFFSFLNFWLCWVFVSGCRLLIAVASLAVEHGLQGLRALVAAAREAPGLRSIGLVVVAHGLSCSTACGIFPDQGLNPSLLRWQKDSLPLELPGKPKILLCKKLKVGLKFISTCLNSLGPITTGPSSFPASPRQLLSCHMACGMPYLGRGSLRREGRGNKERYPQTDLISIC